MSDKRIHKYPIKIQDEQTIRIPEGFQFLDFQLQNGSLALWALVDTKAEQRGYPFYIAGTGNPLPDEVLTAKFLGTAQFGNFVWHLFVGEGK